MNSNTLKRNLPIVLVLLSGILWGTIGIFVRNLNKYGYEAMDIVFIRGIFGTLIMFVFVFLYNKELFKIRIKDIWCFIGSGILSLTFFNLCYFNAINLSSLSIAAILLYTAPSFVMILSFFIFKEKMNGRKITSVIIAFIGCVLVTEVINNPGNISVIGILFGLGAGLGYALYSIFAKFALNKGYHSFTITFYTLAFSILGSMFFTDASKSINNISNHISILIVMLLFGLIATALPYIFYTLGLSGMESGKASVVASIEPVTATCVGGFVFGEKLSIIGVIGMVLVLFSILLVNKSEKAHETHE